MRLAPPQLVVHNSGDFTSLKEKSQYGIRSDPNKTAVDTLLRALRSCVFTLPSFLNRRFGFSGQRGSRNGGRFYGRNNPSLLLCWLLLLICVHSSSVRTVALCSTRPEKGRGLTETPKKVPKLTPPFLYTSPFYSEPSPSFSQERRSGFVNCHSHFSLLPFHASTVSFQIHIQKKY